MDCFSCHDVHMMIDLDTREAIDSQGQEEVKDATSGEEAKKVTKVSKENKTKQVKSRGNWYSLEVNGCGNFRLEDSSKKKQELDFDAIIQNLTQNLTKLFAAGPHVPDLPDQIAEFLYEFVGKTNLNEIRETKKSKVFGNNYDHENHHDKDYIIYALHSLVREIQGGSM
ncbi:hypothetical protein RhiirA5_414835 [Rhizophagus irregularis]|uniref:Uncharacterized protein n=1 Tax=Rhizophagus irregularis TaxID=588596 RepID=A0A2N0PTA0_9GLOM|nr:hypothetical protein RhiirA5_414835 [Rhizophagus irregularis]